MIEQILHSPNFNYLPRAMTAATMRHEIVSQNIANVNTPNYRRSVVDFEDALANELYGKEEDTAGKLKMVRTRDKHLPAESLPKHAMPTVVEDTTTIMRTDNNNVDIDIEMSSMLKNQLYFNALAGQFRAHVNKVRNVITSGQS
ncbi:MAG: flagellar basal body rod protein FlgB [Selenomonadaceae bacterium]|nr:flagellar basal body rod protein FlgB [Selenomonadaceae bacterium]